MTRSVYKGPFVDIALWKKIWYLKHNKNYNKASLGLFKIWSRRSYILPSFVGERVLIHTGKKFHKYRIKEEMVGHKFGEFALTRKKVHHKKKKKKKK